jgi:hypothetical protein
MSKYNALQQRVTNISRVSDKQLPEFEVSLSCLVVQWCIYHNTTRTATRSHW